MSKLELMRLVQPVSPCLSVDSHSGGDLMDFKWCNTVHNVTVHAGNGKQACVCVCGCACASALSHGGTATTHFRLTVKPELKRTVGSNCEMSS